MNITRPKTQSRPAAHQTTRRCSRPCRFGGLRFAEPPYDFEWNLLRNGIIFKQFSLNRENGMNAQTEQAPTKRDRREQPAYPLAEAARYLKLPATTLRSWVVGRPYPKAGSVEHFHPLIKAAQAKPLLLSFWNLIEAHVLLSLRTDHAIAIREVRDAIHYAERELGLERLLLRNDLSTHAGQVFLDQYGKLINLSASGQMAMRRMLEDHLKRVEWDRWMFPMRLYPFVPGASRDDRRIAIDPEIAFGRPIVLRVGVSTGAIANRIDAGESVAELAADYDLTPNEIEQAVLYERAA